MKISIVTVVYNNVLVGEALDSIIAQRMEPGDELEMVVIDGGSTDRTLAILDNYRHRLAVCLSEKDGGIYDAMNKGLELSTGDIIGTLNSDDLYENDSVLANIISAFRENNTDVVYGDLVYVRKENPAKIVRYWNSEVYRDGLFEKGWVPPHPTFFVRKEIYAKYGRFDLKYRLAADFELMVRFLAKARVKSLYVPKLLIRMRLGGATNKNIGNVIKGGLECQRACEANGLSVPIWFIPRRWLSRLPQFFKRVKSV